MEQIKGFEQRIAEKKASMGFMDEWGAFGYSLEEEEMMAEIADLRAALAAQSAAGVGGFLPTVRDLDRISIQFGADLTQMYTDTIKGVDYLQREFVMERLMQWRREWDENSNARPDLRQLAPTPADAVPAQAVQGEALSERDMIVARAIRDAIFCTGNSCTNDDDLRRALAAHHQQEGGKP